MDDFAVVTAVVQECTESVSKNEWNKDMDTLVDSLYPVFLSFPTKESIVAITRNIKACLSAALQKSLITQEHYKEMYDKLSASSTRAAASFVTLHNVTQCLTELYTKGNLTDSDMPLSRYGAYVLLMMMDYQQRLATCLRSDKFAVDAQDYVCALCTEAANHPTDKKAYATELLAVVKLLELVDLISADTVANMISMINVGQWEELASCASLIQTSSGPTKLTDFF